MEFVEQAQYQLWAEKKFFEILEKVSDEDWSKHISGFTKSLQEIYIHKYEVMYFWFTVIFVRDSKKVGENPLGIPDFESISKELFIIEALKLFDKLIQYIRTTENAQLALELEWIKKPYQVTSHEILFNIFNHLTYHRGQTAFIFKKLGYEIPETDYNPYLYTIKKLI